MKLCFAAAQPVTRRNVDNLAALLFDHLRGDRAASVELATQVGVDAAPPILVGDFGELLAGSLVTAAGVVNQDVDFAELLDRRLRERVDLRGDGDVSRHDEALAPGFFDGVGGLVELRLGARGSDDVGAGLGELYRHRATKAAAGACDDGDFAVELEGIQNHCVTSIEAARGSVS